MGKCDQRITFLKELIPFLILKKQEKATAMPFILKMGKKEKDHLGKKETN